MDKEELKARLPEYLESRGISLNKTGPCIVCGGGYNTPCAGYWPAKNVYHCFSCGITYDILDLIAYDNNLDIKGDFEEVCQIGYSMYGTNNHNQDKESRNSITEKLEKDKKMSQVTIEDREDYSEYYQACSKNLGYTDYLKCRGLNEETAKKFSLGYDIKSKCLVIPVSKSFYIRRSTNEEKKFLNLKGAKVVLFNEKVLDSEQPRPIIITESAIDSMSIAQLGGISVALNGTSNAKKLVELIKNKNISNRYILALDNDVAGRKATEELAEAFKSYGISYIVENLSGDCKDINEALVKDESMLKENILKATNRFEAMMTDEQAAKLEQYGSQYQVARKIMGFYEDIKSNALTKCVSTGFSELDKCLDGGFYEGLYFIGAISSLGKTTFALQIADNIAKAGNDVLIFSLEMAQYELIAKSISRLSYSIEKTRGKTVREITDFKRYTYYNEEEIEHIVRCMDTYRKNSEHLYIVEGTGNIGVSQIEEKVKEHIRLTGNKPVVIIDYLQLLIPNDYKMTDKQNMDRAVLRLKCLSRDERLTIVGISSLNRENYSQAISMSAFKESGAIEYSADVLIGLQLKGVGEKDFSADKAKMANPRNIEAVILKNRNGIVGKKIDYLYNSKFNIFVERGRDTRAY